MEYHLFLIWKSGLDEIENILKEIKKNLEIVRVDNLIWPEKIKYKAISRLYQSSIITRFSEKISKAGDNYFVSIIVKDHNPIYKLKINISGNIAWVNENISIVKTNLRNLYDRNFIHSTDNSKEFYYQYLILYGTSLVDYQELNYLKISQIKHQMNYPVNFDGFTNYKEFYNFLNLHDEYLFINTSTTNENQNIILVKDKKYTISITGFEKIDTFNYKLKIGNQVVEFKLIDSNDRVFDNRWSQNMLNKRLFDDGKYILDINNLFFVKIYLESAKYKFRRLFKSSIDYTVNNEIINFNKTMYENSKKYRLSLLKGYILENNYFLYSNSFIDTIRLYDSKKKYMVCEKFLCLLALNIKSLYITLILFARRLFKLILPKKLKNYILRRT